MTLGSYISSYVNQTWVLKKLLKKDMNQIEFNSLSSFRLKNAFFKTILISRIRRVSEFNLFIFLIKNITSHMMFINAKDV